MWGKVLATGNGRCNLTNRNAAPEHYHSADTARLADILERTPPDAVLDFFGEMGLLCDTQADGRVYPYCYQASMVLDVLRAALERAGVDVACSCEVAEVEKGPGGFSVRTRDGRPFRPRVWFWLRAVRPGRSSAQMVPLLLWRACWATVWRSRIHALFRCGAQGFPSD